jgi:hypothetical protein
MQSRSNVSFLFYIKALCIIRKWGSTGNLDRGYETNSMAVEAMPPIGQRASRLSPMVYHGADFFGTDSL